MRHTSVALVVLMLAGCGVPGNEVMPTASSIEAQDRRLDPALRDAIFDVLTTKTLYPRHGKLDVQRVEPGQDGKLLFEGTLVEDYVKHTFSGEYNPRIRQAFLTQYRFRMEDPDRDPYFDTNWYRF